MMREPERMLKETAQVIILESWKDMKTEADFLKQISSQLTNNTVFHFMDKSK